MSPPDRSTFSVKELQRYIRVDAPSRSCRNSYGRPSTNIELQSLILGPAGDSGDLSSLLATKRPRIVVGESGGQSTLYINGHGLIYCQWEGSFEERMHSWRNKRPRPLTSTRGELLRPHPVPKPCKGSIASTHPHQNLSISSVTYFMGRSINNVCRTFKAMAWPGLWTVWTRCVVTFPLPTLCSR